MAKDIRKREIKTEIEKEELKSELRSKQGCGDVEMSVHDDYDFLNR
jgi:hypothetical protein